MWFAVISAFFYLISILLIMPMLLGQGGQEVKLNKMTFLVTALIAIISHFIALNKLFIHLFIGNNFTLIEICSLVSAMIAAIATVAILARVKTLWFLLPIVYCFSIINLILQALLPEIWVYHLSQNTSLLFHIALSLFAYSVCFIAMLYAIQLRWIDNSLKSKKLTFSPVVPPLMTVEKHFFRSLFSGQILLTLTLISGSIQLIDFFSAHNIPKAIFSFLAWFVFGIALFGHWKLYWRGKRMIIYTISGMILLTVAYFGSRVILEL